MTTFNGLALIKQSARRLLNASGEIALVIVALWAFNNGQNITLAWALYLLGAVLLMRVWWFLTRKIPQVWARQVLRLLAAVVLLTPGPVSDIEGISLAPAVVMSALEGVLIRDGDFARAGIPLLISVLMSLVVYAVLELLWHFGLREFVARYLQRANQERRELADRDELLNQSKTVDA